MDYDIDLDFDDYELEKKYRIASNIKGNKQRKTKWREIEIIKEKQSLRKLFNNYYDEL